MIWIISGPSQHVAEAEEARERHPLLLLALQGRLPMMRRYAPIRSARAARISDISWMRLVVARLR
jgi:hypothetical protein